MDNFLVTLIEHITAYNSAVVILSTGFILTLLRSFTPGGIHYQKFCGAIALFLIALVINHYFFYFISIVIGGAVVASEDFVLMFSAVYMAEKKDIPEIVKTYHRLNKEAKYQASVPTNKDNQYIPEVLPSDKPSDDPVKI